MEKQLRSWVRYGDVEAVQRYVQRGTLEGGEGAKLLSIAAGNRVDDAAILKILVERGANPNEIAYRVYMTSLSIAARCGAVEKVRFLLQAGANPNLDETLISALHAPIQTQAQIINLLLDAGANLSSQTLCAALHLSDTAPLKQLLDAGAKSERFGWNSLIHAIVFGTIDELLVELKYGVDLNKEWQHRITPWQLCLQLGDVAKAEKLVEFGANLDSDSLYTAINTDNAKMVQWLIDYGADVNVPSSYHDTVLSKAVVYGASNCLKILIAAGSDIRAENHIQSQPINYAGTPETARILVEAGADINFIGGDGYTLLKSAAESANIDMVRALLDMGADTEAETKYYSTTPLYVAVQVDDLEIARLLLEAGANPNARNVDLWFPLHVAHSLEMVRLLLDYGADIHIKDEVGWDALQHHYANQEIVKCLIHAGAKVKPAKRNPYK